MVQFEWNLINWEIQIRSLAVRNRCEEKLTQTFDQTLPCIMFGPRSHISPNWFSGRGFNVSIVTIWDSSFFFWLIILFFAFFFSLFLFGFQVTDHLIKETILIYFFTFTLMYLHFWVLGVLSSVFFVFCFSFFFTLHNVV